MAINLDKSKAYDKVEWPYLEAAMRSLSFGDPLISLNMECVIIVKYSILLNGRPRQYKTLTRGLRQGDLLSPYLFLICIEGLGSIITMTKAEGDIKGILVAMGGQQINHLLFIDDCILFNRAQMRKW